MDTNMRLDADKIELAKAILSITSKDILDKVKSRLTDILDFHEKEEGTYSIYVGRTPCTHRPFYYGIRCRKRYSQQRSIS